MSGPVRRDTGELSVHLLCAERKGRVETEGEGDNLKIRRRASPEPEPCWKLVLDFLASRMARKYISVVSAPYFGIL